MINKDGEYESFYPNDVDRITQKAGTVSDSEKLTAFIALFIMCNVGLGMILPQFVVKMGGNIFLAILIQLLLNAVFGTTIFRFFVFKENDRVKEYKSYGQDSFSGYFKIGKEPVMEINVEGYGTVDVFGLQIQVCIWLHYIYVTVLIIVKKIKRQKRLYKIYLKFYVELI